MGGFYWNRSNVWVVELEFYVFFKDSLTSIFCESVPLTLKVLRRKSYLSSFILCWSPWFSEFLSSYPCYKGDIFNFKLLVIIFISQENLYPPFYPAHQQRKQHLISLSFPPTACFIMPVLFTSAQLPNLIHLLGYFYLETWNLNVLLNYQRKCFLSAFHLRQCVLS